MMGTGYTLEFLGTTIWHRSFAFFPHRSVISGKWIWLKNAYACSKSLRRGQDEYYTTTWRTEQEHMMEIIKG